MCAQRFIKRYWLSAAAAGRAGTRKFARLREKLEHIPLFAKIGIITIVVVAWLLFQ